MPATVTISTTVDIFDRDGQWAVTVGGEPAGSFDTDEAAIDALPAALRASTASNAGVDEDGGADDAAISSSVEIFSRGSQWWLTMTGEMFGPFCSSDEAIDATPEALRILP